MNKMKIHITLSALCLLIQSPHAFASRVNQPPDATASGASPHYNIPNGSSPVRDDQLPYSPAALDAGKSTSNADLGFQWQDWTDTGVGSEGGDIAHSSAHTDTLRFYQSAPVSGWVQAPQHSAYRTSNQSRAVPSTASGMTITGTQFAPGNLSLMQQYHRSFGGTLPKTTLDSFVARSGYSDAIYGGEGTDGPPPYSGFTPSHYIENGLHSSALSTGHHDRRLVSSWDFPNTADEAQKLP